MSTEQRKRAISGIADILQKREQKKEQKREQKEQKQKQKEEKKKKTELRKREREERLTQKVLKRQKKEEDAEKKAKKGRTPEESKCISLLTAYGKNEWLGPYLKDSHEFDLRPTTLRKMSLKKLEETVDDVELVLANKTNSAIGDGAVRAAMYQLEMLAADRTSFNPEGTTDKCFANDHWRFLLERAKLKYGFNISKMDPVLELSLITFQTAAMMHYSNALQVPKTDLDVEVKLE